MRELGLWVLLAIPPLFLSWMTWDLYRERRRQARLQAVEEARRLHPAGHARWGVGPIPPEDSDDWPGAV